MPSLFLLKETNFVENQDQQAFYNLQIKFSENFCCFKTLKKFIFPQDWITSHHLQEAQFLSFEWQTAFQFQGDIFRQYFSRQ